MHSIVEDGCRTAGEVEATESGWMGWVDTAHSEVKPIAERSYFEVQVQVDLEAAEGAALSGPVWPCLALSILPNPVLQWVFGLWVWPAWSDE